MTQSICGILVLNATYLFLQNLLASPVSLVRRPVTEKQRKAVPLNAMMALGGRGDIALTHS
jgi:hypothetical protein